MPIDMSAATAPPRKKAAGTTTATRARSTMPVETQSVTERRAEGLNGLGQLAQGILLMTGQYADAAAIGQHFPPLAMELARVADTSEMLAKPIDLLIEVGPYGALIAAAMPLALQLMANHKLIDASGMIGQGVVPPELLEAQMKAQVARMQTEAMQAQQTAIREARQAQAAFEAMMTEPTQTMSTVNGTGR